MAEDKLLGNMKETELAKPIISYLEDLKWDVYQEVLIRGPIADIVATFGKLTWIIECKTSLSLKLMEQANSWVGKANFISIAIPVKSRIGNEFIRDILKWKGVGVLTVNSYLEVNEYIRPRLNRKTIDISKFLKQEQKTFAEAGNNLGKYFTPFQNTVLEIQKVVRNKQGILFNDLIKELNHHYKTPSTAKSCLRQWIESGIIRNIFIRKEDNLLRVYYDK